MEKGEVSVSKKTLCLFVIIAEISISEMSYLEKDEDIKSTIDDLRESINEAKKALEES